jgi:hypothetical protein
MRSPAIAHVSLPAPSSHACEQGRLRGCFALTELGLGVMSGSTVRTRLLDAPGGGFYLHNLDDASAAKVWISCGEVAIRPATRVKLRKPLHLSSA